MSENESLGDILSNAAPPAEKATDVKPETPGPSPGQSTDKPTAETEAKAKAETEAKAKAEADAKAKSEEKARDEKGRFTKSDEELAGTKAALKAERARRQELEREKREREAAAKPKTDFWEDPEKALEERLAPKEAALTQQVEARFFNLCENLCKQRHDDYDEVVSELLDDAEADAGLGAQVFAQARAATDPAEFLYTYSLNRRELKAVGNDLGKYKAKVAAERDEKIAKLEAENKKLAEQLEKVSKVPDSLNSEPSSTRASMASEAVQDDSLEEITKPRKRARA